MPLFWTCYRPQFFIFPSNSKQCHTPHALVTLSTQQTTRLQFPCPLCPSWNVLCYGNIVLLVIVSSQLSSDTISLSTGGVIKKSKGKNQKKKKEEQQTAMQGEKENKIPERIMATFLKCVPWCSFREKRDMEYWIGMDTLSINIKTMRSLVCHLVLLC